MYEGPHKITQKCVAESVGAHYQTPSLPYPTLLKGQLDFSSILIRLMSLLLFETENKQFHT